VTEKETGRHNQYRELTFARHNRLNLKDRAIERDRETQRDSTTQKTHIHRVQQTQFDRQRDRERQRDRAPHRDTRTQRTRIHRVQQTQSDRQRETHTQRRREFTFTERNGLNLKDKESERYDSFH